jgi:hypothetical protein
MFFNEATRPVSSPSVVVLDVAAVDDDVFCTGLSMYAVELKPPPFAGMPAVGSS